MKMNHNSPISRRNWLRVASGLGLGAAISTIASDTARAAEKSTLTYHQAAEAAPWTKRSYLGVVVFRDRLWVLGGTGTGHNGTHLNDVWSSEDGVHWRQELASAPWQPRWDHAVFAFGDRLWVIGGLASLEPLQNLNDMWSSPEGREWTREVADAPWRARHVWAWTINRGRMFLLGGASDGSRSYRDVISSDDGTRWRIETPGEPWFEARKYFAATSYRGQIILAAGDTNDPSQRGDSRYLEDVWSSEDGRTWTCLTPRAPWSPRLGHALIVYRRKLWLVGGELVSRDFATDLWSTLEGKNWRKETEHFAWPPRLGSGVVVFNDKVWILGGARGEGLSTNDIWTFEEQGG